jgi:streptogrisin C
VNGRPVKGRARRAAIGLATLVLAASAAATASAVTSSGPVPAGGTRLPAGGTRLPAADPQLLAAMQRDLRLNPEQARHRLASQATAARTLARVRTELRSGYVGAWLDHDAGTPTVAITDPGLAGQVRAAGAVPVVVARGADDLGSAKSRLDERARQAPASVRGWYVEPRTDAVVMLTRPGGEQQAREFAGADVATVRVVTAEHPYRTLADIFGGDQFATSRVSCSVGFATATNSYLTAGHCGQVGDIATGPDGERQGLFTQSTFPGSDFAEVSLGDGASIWTLQPAVNDHNGAAVPVRGSQEAPVGAATCHSGFAGGWRCGTIEATDVTVNYQEGMVIGLVRTNVCAEPGDSGGPFMSGDQAQGLLSGGSGNCSTGGDSFYSPINPILSSLHARLLLTSP